MNPPPLNVPLSSGLCKERSDFFRAPSVPPPLTPTNGTPSPLHWIHHSNVTYDSLTRFSGASNTWESFSHYFKTSSPVNQGNTFGFYGSSPGLSPAPAHTHPYLSSSLLSSGTTPPPVAHSHNEAHHNRPFNVGPGVFRPIPSRPPPSTTPLVVPRVDFESGIKSLKFEDKLQIKMEPDSLNDSDSAFEDGEGSLNCSRTTPVNHKSLKRWRQRSQSSPMSDNTFSTPQRPLNIPDISRNQSSLSSPGSLSSSWNSPFSSPKSFQNVSSSSTDSLLNSSNNGLSFGSKPIAPPGNIPVGIAVARLRPNNNNNKTDDSVDLKKEHSKEESPFQLNIPKVPAPSTCNSKDSTLLPLGYQWAKDPITGQIFFLPSNPLWATTPGYGYLQWQQESWLAHQNLQFSLNRGGIGASPLLSSLPASVPPPPVQKPVNLLSPNSEVDVVTSGGSTDENMPLINEEDEDRTVKKTEVKVEVNGLELLTEGINRLEGTKSVEEINKNGLSILIDAADKLESSTDSKFVEDKPKEETRTTSSVHSDLNRNYRSPETERDAKAFIASKSIKSPGIHPPSDEFSLPSPKRTTDDMEAWEIGMRLNLAEIQRKYKEKYKELYKLQKSSRRRKSSSDSGSFSLPKKIKTEKLNNSPLNTTFNDTFVKKYKPDGFKSEASTRKASDLSSITDKFKNGRPNPFENLLRLSKNRQSLDDDEEESREEEEEESREEDEEIVKDEDEDVVDEREILVDKDKVVAKVFKRRKSEDNKSNGFDSPPLLEPLIIPVKDQIVSPLKIKKTYVSSGLEESEDFECGSVLKKKSKKSKKNKKNKKDKLSKKRKKVKKMRVSVIRTPPTSSCLDITVDKEQENIKWNVIEEGIEDEDDEEEEEDPYKPTAEDCVICEDDLREGLRVLTKIEGHFHPSVVKEISPPDIYGVLVDKERGNKPHIFSREEVLKEAIFEVKPNNIRDVPVGTRVCAYWSHKYHHLYPGTVGEPGSPNPKLDPKYFVNVELDDGDSRDIHIDNVRYLPPNYPLVLYEPDPMSFGSRRKRIFSTDSTMSTSSFSSTKSSRDEILYKEGSGNCNSTSAVPRVVIKSTNLKLKIRSSQDNCEKTYSAPSNKASNKSSMAAFLPAQQLWCWADQGTKKGRRIVHQSIKRDDEDTLSVGACAVFLSTGRPDRPYIGRLESLWETSGSNSVKNMRVKVKWFYHACETKGSSDDGETAKDLKLPGALFESCHYDENDVQTISHGCDVLSVEEYFKRLSKDPSKMSTIYENHDLYYLAGNYDPVKEKLEFSPRVFSDYDI